MLMDNGFSPKSQRHSSVCFSHHFLSFVSYFEILDPICEGHNFRFWFDLAHFRTQRSGRLRSNRGQRLISIPSSEPDRRPTDQKPIRQDQNACKKVTRRKNRFLHLYPEALFRREMIAIAGSANSLQNSGDEWRAVAAPIAAVERSGHFAEKLSEDRVALLETHHAWGWKKMNEIGRSINLAMQTIFESNDTKAYLFLFLL